jgi:hypothetical protein
MLKRIHGNEEGFALVTAIGILAIMTILLVVVLSAGQGAFEVSERNSRFTRTLGVAEAGVNDAVTRLGEVRGAENPCEIGTLTVCQAPNGEYQVRWEPAATGDGLMITAVGYYPSKAQEQISRTVQVLLEPAQSFTYALFSNSTLDVKNNEIVFGDIYASQKITLGNGAVVCGSVINGSGGVEAGNGTQILKSYGASCSDKSGSVWAGGTITLNAALVQGDATASAPSDVTCPPNPNTTYAIVGGTVQGTATACGAVTSSTPNPVPNTATSPPAVVPMPSFTFDPANYPGINCYAATTNPCTAAAPSTTAVATFNTTVPKVNMSGTYAIWQSQPTQATRVNLENLTLGGDLTIVTNAPIDLGNTGTVTSSVPATLVIISTYIPPEGTNCEANGGDCSIYGKNKVVFDSGDPASPDDGIVALLYTPGKMAFKNQANEGEGALYAGSMDLKNGYDVTYNVRIERVLGFGAGLEQTLWQELSG